MGGACIIITTGNRLLKKKRGRGGKNTACLGEGEGKGLFFALVECTEEQRWRGRAAPAGRSVPCQGKATAGSCPQLLRAPAAPAQPGIRGLKRGEENKKKTKKTPRPGCGLGLQLRRGSKGLQRRRAGCCGRLCYGQHRPGRAGAGIEAIWLLCSSTVTSHFIFVVPSSVSLACNGPAVAGLLGPRRVGVSPEGRGLYVWHLSHSCITSTPVSLVHNFKRPTFWLALCRTPGFLSTLCCSGSGAACPPCPAAHVPARAVAGGQR